MEANLIKIIEVTRRYDISARTLRYYEDMNLITSTRTDDYAYRLYDETALRRLEQVLILRRLGISIRDIQRVFAKGSAEAVMEVLGTKVQDIDEEVALLHELREIVLDFIRQINEANFAQDADIQRLYAKATEIETRLSTNGYQGNPAGSASRMLEITERLDRRPDVRIVQLPACRMITSRAATGDPFRPGGELDQFEKWFGQVDHQRKDKFFARDFMWFDPERGGLVWWYALEEGLGDTCGFDAVDFEGGLYATGVSRDEDDADGNRVYEGIKAWIADSGYFELDEREGHQCMFHIITSPIANEAMGYNQLEMYVPIRLRFSKA